MKIHDLQELRIAVRMLAEDLGGAVIHDTTAPRAEVLAAAGESAELAATLSTLVGTLIAHARVLPCGNGQAKNG